MRRHGYMLPACSGAEWLMGTLGLAHPTASTWVRTARALEHRPVMAEAFADGLLSFDKVVPLCRVTDPVDDEEATAEAIGLSAAQVKPAARRKPRAAWSHRRARVVGTKSRSSADLERLGYVDVTVVADEAGDTQV